MVPAWLTGTWKRTYIRRRRSGIIPTHENDGDGATSTCTMHMFGNTDHLGESDSTIDVTYIQTPWAFVDVRSKSSCALVNSSKEKPMAFAGVTTVQQEESGSDSAPGLGSVPVPVPVPPLVKWHACLDIDERSMDCRDRWIEAEEGKKTRPTNDVGYFLDVSKDVGIDHTYHEYDPDQTLLEQWVRIDDGDGKFLAVRNEKGTSLLVVAGEYFGYANQEDMVFLAGVVENGAFQSKENWVIKSSTVASSTEDLRGTTFTIPEQGDDNWKVLKGSTLSMNIIKCLLESEMK